MNDIFLVVQKRVQERFWEAVEVDFKDEKGDGKHFFLSIVSAEFLEKGRVERSQLVYNLLDDLLKTGGIHALRMNLKTPEEL